MSSSRSSGEFGLDMAIRALRDVAIAVAAFRTVPEIVGAIAHGLQQLPSGPAVTVGVALSDDEPLRLSASEGFDPETIDRWQTIDRAAPVPLTDVLRTGEILYFRSRESFLSEYPDLRHEVESSEHHSWVALPLVSEMGPSGTLGLAWDHERDFGESERSFLLTLAKLGGEALRRVSREIDRRDLVLLLADASDHERMEIARDLHDQSVQRLAAASIRLGSIRMDHFGDLAPEARSAISMVETDVQEVIRTLRNIIVDLHPPDMGDLDLGQAVTDYAEWLFESRAEVDIDDQLGLPMSDPMADTAYRIITEAMSNAARHASASRVDVRIAPLDDDRFEVSVTDDGVGLVGEPTSAGSGHLGFRLIDERVANAGGTHQIDGRAGMRVAVQLPFVAPDRRVRSVEE